MKINITKRFLLSLCLMTLTLLCGGNKAWGQSEINFTTTLNAETDMTKKTWTVDDVSIAFNKGTNSNGPKFYKATKNTVAAVRMYKGNTMTISVPESSTIKSIVFSLGTTKTSPVIPSTGSLSGDKTTWTSPSDGNTNSVSFSIGTGQFHITSISITYETTPAPKFSLTEGTYNGPQHVTITAPKEYTEGIVYTTDGNDPTTSGINYTSAGIDITATTTLRAVARNSEGNFSGEATATYTITYNAPTFSLPGGTYYGAQSVSISVTDLGSGSIFYTTDDTDPITNGTEYTGAISLPVGSNLTLKAVAKYGEGLFSDVTEATYDIQKAPSTFYQRITSAAELTANETYLIVCESKSKAFGKINSSKKGTPQDVTITDHKIDLSAGGTGTPTEFILEKSNESGYLLKNPTTGKYIVLVDDDTNVTETETGTALNISFETDGSAKIYKSGTTRQILYRASTFNVFGNYGNNNVNESGYNKVYLYKKHVVKEFSDTEDLTASLPKTSALADQTITLDRKVFKGWNTFCVPFALTQTQLEEAYGSGAVAKYLSDVTTGAEGATLHFTPEAEGGIEANKAYLLYLTADVTEAKTFSGVTLQPAGTCTTTVSASNGDYTFQGILKPTTLTTDDRQYFLNSAGTNFVLPSNSTSAMKATRAYITVPAASGSAQGRQYSFDFNGTTTGIDNVNISGLEDGAWYTISGIRVNRPAAKGVYIHNGRKVIVK